MARDMKELITDYDTLISRKPCLDFTVGEISQVVHISKDGVDFVMNALRAGYMAGWHAAKKDSRAAARKTKKCP